MFAWWNETMTWGGYVTVILALGFLQVLISTFRNK